MFRNTFQSGFLSILYSLGYAPALFRAAFLCLRFDPRLFAPVEAPFSNRSFTQATRGQQSRNGLRCFEDVQGCSCLVP